MLNGQMRTNKQTTQPRRAAAHRRRLAAPVRADVHERLERIVDAGVPVGVGVAEQADVACESPELSARRRCKSPALPERRPTATVRVGAWTESAEIGGSVATCGKRVRRRARRLLKIPGAKPLVA